ncbi:MAG: hypothetical protein QF732_02755 [Nitrospinaceae bacterium]|jgi:flagellar motility protein MotE (MotC chaperone)|nr:hypothetical protein [Nitrospinaceae bacterium]
MKKLIVPIIIALLIVAGIAAATIFWVMPVLEEYAKDKADAMVQAGEELHEVAQKHADTPATRFDDPQSTPEESRLSAEAIQNMVASGSSMTFDNPDVHTLMRELQRRLKDVQRREDRISKIETELSLNWNNLSNLTNEIAQARTNLSDKLLDAVDLIKRTQEDGYRLRAQVLTNMPPADAVTTLRQESDSGEIAKLLFLMEVTEQAALISELNKGPEEDQKLASDILKEFNRIGLESAEEGGGP